MDFIVGITGFKTYYKLSRTTDSYFIWNVQIWRWWFPFWCNVHFIGFRTKEQAEQLLTDIQSANIYYEL